MSNLLVYSASAGSGKTHSIAGQYIMMLFSKKQAHRNILAITFTNKACEEMKVRIVEEMYKVASNHKDSRIDEIAEFTKLPKANILNQAKHIFKDILHDYSFFSVSTIDSFFQKIVRNFTRETGIQYNYEIELDKESIVNKAVDDMLELSTNDKNLKKNIINLVQQNIDNSKKWDFRKDLKSFIKNVIESDYRMYEEAYNEFFSSKEQKTAFLKELNSIEKTFLSHIESYCTEMKDVMLKYNIELGAFSGGSGRSIPSRLIKTHDKAKDSALDIDAHFNNYDNIEKWLKKADLDKEPLKTATLQLISTAEKLKEYYESHHKDYYTSYIIRQQLNYTALIDSALEVVRKNLHDSGKFLISEVPVFLSEIANQNSSSFIYEKTGTYYESYLIDEFQDTSRLQWDSLKPLLSESLANADESKVNILVGDLKQSIYSWRGGDWRLLAIDVKREFSNFYKEISLDENWRSGENIVEFNNLFFQLSSEILKDSVLSKFPNHLHEYTGELITNSIYEHIIQKPKKSFESYVEVNLFESKSTYSNKEIQAEIVKRMIHQIEDLQEKNHQPGDIMILVRKHSEGTFIAEEIIKYAQSSDAKSNVIYDVISSEALLISANKAIRLIISCLKYLVNNSDLLSFTEAAFLYYIQTSEIPNDKIEFLKDDYILKLEESISELNNSFRFKLLHEVIDSIILKLDLNKNEANIPFFNSFRDLVHEFSLNNTSTLEYFIEYWEDKGITQNLKIPEKQNAINIITVHKSKGLAAEFVFVPFCNWKFEPTVNNLTWASTDVEPFGELPIWPINLEKKLASSHFSEHYYLNMFKALVEAYNMMYVAFTRAKQGLFISAEMLNDKSFKLASTLIQTSIERLKQTNKIEFDIIEEDGYITYSNGTIKEIEKKERFHSYINNYDVYIPDKQIKIRPFYDKEKVDSDSTNHIKEGIIYHKLFENISLIDDSNSAVDNLVNLGQIDYSRSKNLKKDIKTKLSQEFVKDWFNGTYTITNEAEIVSKSGYFRRPDRIMENQDEVIIVDYKFGNLEKPSYIKQTKEYANLLKEMGYQNIKTYIWFVLMNYLLEVDTKTGNTKKIILEK